MLENRWMSGNWLSSPSKAKSPGKAKNSPIFMVKSYNEKTKTTKTKQTKELAVLDTSGTEQAKIRGIG